MKYYVSEGRHLTVALASRVSGDVGIKGNLGGVILTDTDTDGNVVMDTQGVYKLYVEAVTASGNSAVAFGDPIYASAAGAQASDATVLSKDSTGTIIGHALGTVLSGAIGQIPVRLIGAKPGIGETVETAEIADGAVTTAKLDGEAVDETILKGNLAVGFIPLDITTARIISTNAIQDTTEAGVPDGNTSPSLARVNGATDKSLRLAWAAGSSEEIQFAPIPKPPDLDDGAAMTIHLMLAKDTNTDTGAVVGVSAWDGVGDTNAGGNTAALASAALAEKSVSVAAGDIAAAPGFFNVSVTPGTHAADAVYLYSAWIEYARKG